MYIYILGSWRPVEDVLFAAFLVTMLIVLIAGLITAASGNSASSRKDQSAEWYEQEAKRLAAQTEYELKKAEYDDVVRLIDDQRRKGRTWP